jgi:hypothetical protein
VCWDRGDVGAPLARPDPSATLSPSIDFLVEPVIRSALLQCFLAGARRASPVAWYVLAAVLSLSPRRDQDASSVRFRHPMLPSPFVFAGSASGFICFRGHFACHYGPVTCNLPKRDLVDGLQSLGFPPPCHPSYGASDFCPAGLIPAEHTSLRCTHKRSQLSRLALNDLLLANRC